MSLMYKGGRLKGGAIALELNGTKGLTPLKRCEGVASLALREPVGWVGGGTGKNVKGFHMDVDGAEKEKSCWLSIKVHSSGDQIRLGGSLVIQSGYFPSFFQRVFNMSQGQNNFSVKKLYQTVIDDVMAGVREAFLDEGVDEQVLQELKMLWESKLLATRAVEPAASSNDKSNVSNTDGANQHQNRTNSNAFNNAPPQQPTTTLPADPNEMIPIQITMPSHPNDPTSQRSITIQVPASCIHSNKLQEVLSLPSIQAALSLPSEIATVQCQQQILAALGMTSGAQNSRNPASSVITQMSKPASVITSQSQNQAKPLNPMVHLDGGTAGGDSSDEEEEEEDDDDDFDDDIDDKDEEREEEPEDEGQDEEPLNSGDDVSDNEDSNDKLYEIDNVVVCQYDKITRSRNKWKFHLKDGIMNLNGKDYVFQKATGDAEW